MSSVVPGTSIALVSIATAVGCHQLLNHRPYSRAADGRGLGSVPLLATLCMFADTLVGIATWGLSGAASAVLSTLALAPIVLAAAIDLDVHRVPDVLTVTALPLSFIAVLSISGTGADRFRAALAAFAALVLVSGLGLLAHRLGSGDFPTGDVLVAVSVAPILGAHGWGSVIIGGTAAFTSAGLVGITNNRHSAQGLVAFAPHVVVGAVLGLWIARIFM